MKPEFASQLKWPSWPPRTPRIAINILNKLLKNMMRFSRAGGFQTGGLHDLDLSVLLGLPRFFWGDFPPDCSFSSVSAIKKTPTKPERVRDNCVNQDLSRKKWESPGLEPPRFTFSLSFGRTKSLVATTLCQIAVCLTINFLHITLFLYSIPCGRKLSHT